MYRKWNVYIPELSLNGGLMLFEYVITRPCGLPAAQLKLMQWRKLKGSSPESASLIACVSLGLQSAFVSKTGLPTFTCIVYAGAWSLILPLKIVLGLTLFETWAVFFSFVAGTHYPYSRAVFTGREHGRNFCTTVNTARVSTGDILMTNTAREHGCRFFNIRVHGSFILCTRGYHYKLYVPFTSIESIVLCSYYQTLQLLS